MVDERRRSTSPERGDNRLNKRPRTGDSSSPSLGNTSEERENYYLRYLRYLRSSPRESDQQQQQVSSSRPAEVPLTSSIQELGKSKEVPSLPDDQHHEFLSPRDYEKETLFVNIQIVKNSNKGNYVLADENIKKGDSILSFIGDVLPIDKASTDLSLQINENSCIESTVFFDNNINHSCKPNCYIDFGQDANQPPRLVTIRDIKKGEELSFDYNTTDYDLKDSRWKSDFDCNCRAENCVGEIAGYKHLTLEQKKEISPFLAPFLKKIYDEEIREHKDC